MERSIAYLHAELKNQDDHPISLATDGRCEPCPTSTWSFEMPQQARQQRAWMWWLWIDKSSPWQLAHCSGLNGRGGNANVQAEHPDPCPLDLDVS